LKKLIFFIALVAVGALSVGMLSNTIVVAPQEMGSFDSTIEFNSFECSCEDPDNPGTFDSQFCSTGTTLCP